MKESVLIALIGIVPSILTLVVTSITNHKVKKQQNLKEEIQKGQNQLKEEVFNGQLKLRKEMQSGFDKLNRKIDNNRMKALKNTLVNNYTELINGGTKSKEQLQDIAEMFEEYKQLGGDSYIDDLHDIWKAKQIKK